ncbi:MAG: PAS domain-containing protein [Archangiaceae bacterium]|nr:PAS domain-containing protein [Archangiaceae bacterium]
MLHQTAGDLSLPLLEHVPVGLIVWRLVDEADDQSLSLVGFNAAAEKMIKLDMNARLGQRVLDAFPRTQPQRVTLYAKLAREGGVVDLGETVYDDPHIERSVFTVRAVGIGNRATAVFIENLTALKRATAFLDAIIENLPNMLFVKEAKALRFERFNRAGEELLGVKRDALLGKNDFDLFPAEQATHFQARDRAALEGNAVVDIAEEPIQTASGERWLHTRKVPILDAGGTPRYLLGISEDITDRKAAGEQLEKMVAQLKESNAELESFSYSVSHDLRAPLRAIDGFAKVLLEDHAAALGDEGRRVLGIIAKNAVKMGQLIDDLLAFSRSGRKPIERKRVDMTGLSRAAAELVREAGRNLDLRLSPLPPCEGDPVLLEQVWVNLLANAVKYTRRREQAIIEVSGERRGREVVYAVKDNGVGFDMKYEAKLFGVFQRLHTAAEYEGTGVGLALVQRIVKRHGGWVKATGVLDQGAVLSFGLPAVEE